MRCAPFVAAVLLAGSAVACGDDAGPTDAAAASAACGTLVAWTNAVAEIVNATQDEMVEGADRRALMLEAVDAVTARTDALGDELAEVEVPATDGGRAFLDDLRSGQEEAATDLAGLREEIEAVPDPDPESLNYRKAQLVVELEKPRTLVKPDVQDDLGDADLEAAIAAEPSCGSVTRAQ